MSAYEKSFGIKGQWLKKRAGQRKPSKSHLSTVISIKTQSRTDTQDNSFHCYLPCCQSFVLRNKQNSKKLWPAPPAHSNSSLSIITMIP